MWKGRTFIWTAGPLSGHVGFYLEDGPLGGQCGPLWTGWAFIWRDGPLSGQSGLLCGQGGLLSGQLGPYLDIWAFIWKIAL